MEDFAKQFLARKKIAMEHGDRERVAKAAGVSKVAVSRWGTTLKGALKLPTIGECAAVADELDVSAAWLAFGQGPQSSTAAVYGASIAKKLSEDERLATIIAAYDTTDDKGKEVLLSNAKFVAPKIPAGATISTDHGKKFFGAPETKVSEEPAAYPNFKVVSGPPIHETTPQATGPDVPVYKLSFEPRDGFKVTRHIEDLAAGYGVPDGSFESLGDAYVQGKDMKSHGFTVAKVRGDSMLSYLEDGEHILLKDFPTEKRLPRINKKSQKMSLAAWQRETQIYDNDVVVVDLGTGDGPTLKRVHYDTTRGTEKWKMQIVANNPPAWREAFQIETGDEPVFYAKLMARLEPV